MWTISMLKDNAKAALKRFYWMAVLASFIAALLGGGGMGSGSGSSSSSSSTSDDYSDLLESYGITSGADSSYYSEDNIDGMLEDYYADPDSFDSSAAETAANAAIGIVLAVTVIILIAAVGFSVFVGGVVRVGHERFYLDARQGDVSLGKLFNNFGNGRYLNTVKTMFLMNVKIVLWTLLFIIPGIIKSYEYILIPYILADNPNIDSKRAFEISSQTMKGEKANCFVLGLSFIGWNLLGSLLIIGGFFVAPYINATFTEFYCCMKQKAISTGIATADEFGEDSFGNTQMFGEQSFNNGGFTSSQSSSYTSTNSFAGTPAGNYQPTTAQPAQPEQPPKPSYTPGVMDDISFDNMDSLADANSTFGSGGSSSGMDGIEDLGVGIDDSNDDYNGPEIN